MLSQCPACKKQIEVPPSVLGKKVRCSGCQAVFVAEAPPPPKEEEPLDMLEVLPEKPAAPQKKPVAKKPAPKPKESESSLDFTNAADPKSEFSFVESTKKVNPGVQLRTSTAASFLRYTALYAILPTLLQTAYPIILAVVAHSLPAMAIGCVPLVTYMISVIFILIGAGSLQNMTSLAMALTGAIISLLIGIAALALAGIMAVIVAIALYAGGGGPLQIVAVAMVLLTFIQGALSIWGGLRVMLVCFNSDVRAEMASDD